MTVTVYQRDCLAVLPTLAAGSVDACVTDPPYHLTSMVRRHGPKAGGPGIPGCFSGPQPASWGRLGTATTWRSGRRPGRRHGRAGVTRWPYGSLTPYSSLTRAAITAVCPIKGRQGGLEAFLAALRNANLEGLS